MNLFTTYRTPLEIREDIRSNVSPNLDTNLPAGLLSGIIDTGSVVVAMCERAASSLALTVSANSALTTDLEQVGESLGIIRRGITYASAQITFSGAAGTYIPSGTVVSNSSGTHTYLTNAGVIINSSGSVTVSCTSPNVLIVDNPNTLQDYTPVIIGVSCTNLTSSSIGSRLPETDAEYASRIKMAYTYAGTNTFRAIISEVSNITGVNRRLVALNRVEYQASPLILSGYRLIVGGGDRHEIANAVYGLISDPSLLRPSLTAIRNTSVSIIDGGSSVGIVIVEPSVQLVTATINYTSNETHDISGFISAAKAVAYDYINGIKLGYPLNIMMLESLIRAESVSGGYMTNNGLTELIFTFSITKDGTPLGVVSPDAGTRLISGDAEGYFYTTLGQITVL